MLTRQFLALAITLLISSSALGLELISTVAISGRAQDVRLNENHAFCADQYGLWVLDLSNPAQPVSLSHWGSPGICSRLELMNDYAFICDGDQGMAILDISSPNAPSYLGQVAEITGAFDARISNGYLYVATGMDGLAVLDVSNPEAPLRIGEYATSSWAGSLAVDANLIALATAESQVFLLSANDPANPALLGQIELTGTIQDVILSANQLTVLLLESGISIFDVSDPQQPDLMSSFATGGWSTDALQTGDSLYISDWIGGISIYDVSDPWRPDSVSFFAPNGLVQGMDKNGNWLYLAVGDRGLEVWDLTDISNPVYQGAEIPQGSPQDVVYAPEGYIYEAAGGAGLRVWEADFQPEQPVAQVQTPGWANSVVLSQNWVYLSDGFGGVRIFSRSPTPEETFVLSPDEYAGALTINAANNVFVAQSDSGFYGFQLEGFAAPQEYGYAPTANFVYSLAAYGNLLIACEGAGGFEIFDVANPANPQFMALEQPDGGAWCGQMAGSEAYVGTGVNGIGVFDLSDPQSPFLAGSTAGVGWVQSLSLVPSGILIASSGIDGIFALSTGTTLPVVYDAFDTPGLAIKATAIGSAIYCADEMDLTLLGGLVGVFQPMAAPLSFDLLQAFPNPFNPTAKISFSLSTVAQVELGVYDVLGRQVASLLSGRLNAGEHSLAWEPENTISSGSYWVRMKVGSQQAIHPLIYIK